MYSGQLQVYNEYLCNILQTEPRKKTVKATLNLRVCMKRKQKICSRCEQTTCLWWTPPWYPLSRWPLTPMLWVRSTPCRTSSPVSDSRLPCWSSTKNRSTSLSVGSILNPTSSNFYVQYYFKLKLHCIFDTSWQLHDSWW